jgi:thioredoxin reductase (NADPH)
MADDSAASARVRILGTTGSAGAYALRDFLQRGDVPFDWIQLASDDQARTQAGVDNLADPRLPVCIFPDGSRLENPTIQQVTEKLGWFHQPALAEYDLAIYGAGPAGLSAAVYGASEGLKTVLVERSVAGGQAGTSSKIENYLGFPSGISGADLAERAREQACRFGVDILLAREAVSGEFTAGKGIGHLADGSKIVSRASVCATGIQYNRLNLSNEQRLAGAGVFYGAGASEASLCAQEHVVVVGGGNSAGQAAMHFSRYASKVTIVIRDACLKITLSRYLVDRIAESKNIEVLSSSEVTAISGESVLEHVEVTNRKTGQTKSLATRWLFICIGGAPHTDWAIDAGIQRDEAGYLLTGPDMFVDGRPPSTWPLDRSPYYLETSQPGMFAAGDVRHGSVKRCASAVGEGAMAVTFVHRYLADV